MINNIVEIKNYKFFRLIFILINDLLILNFSISISYFLRIEYFPNFIDVIYVHFSSSLIYLILFFLFNIRNQYFRFFNSNSYNLYLKLFISYIFLFSIYVFFQNQSYLPRSLAAIFPSFFFGCLIFNRILISKLFQKILNQRLKRSVVFGFNPTNINSLLSFSKISCFVDDNKKNSKRIINGIKILTSKDFNLLYNKINFNQILIENESAFDACKNLIRDHIFSRKILVQKISFKNNEIYTSSYFDFNYFFNRKNKTSKLGNIYDNKTILITGAGGSIGSNIVLQLLNSKFKKLILLDNSEFNLYNLGTNLKKNKKIIYKLVNFNDNQEIHKIFLNFKLDIVFHAAAYKHVPIIESNPFSAIKNNFLDTFNFMKIVSNYKIPYFCLISSDKAVRPTNIMGASKRLSELGLRFIDKSINNKTIFNCVRFGNVVNSSGSVKPLFQRQIDQNLNITLTHKSIIRYFMTIEEAANLVLNVYKISKGGEIFLLDMGKPIKLLDLARIMIQFSGKSEKINGKGDINIKIIGLRRGEKLYEELLVDNKSIKTEVKNIFQSIEINKTNKEFTHLFKIIKKAYEIDDIKSLLKALKSDDLIKFRVN